MIEPFAVVALSPRTFSIEKRADALKNTKRICDFMDTACMVGAWEGAPARLVVIPEMAIQGLIAAHHVPGIGLPKRSSPSKFRGLKQRSFAGRLKRSMPISQPNSTW